MDGVLMFNKENKENGVRSFDGPLRYWEIPDPYIIKANKKNGRSTGIAKYEKCPFFLKVKVDITFLVFVIE